ncbi:undecaprenyl-diphosphate phosphatase [Alkalisalibacterium limincola]|uniref:Undecaprenyl-diphosphatase n=1 Tax=Alkalisalibacterium limincola TaxID=2699169 RepID=A0A5C8L0R7_9GAMM|nr:undecaprenyl-diphosphate phosphatase [Alkalisalibacterium limincola]TXK65845.1 undecaprenyl-diphosphate phosphatase [Alkalisalibacterium limincola]
MSLIEIFVLAVVQGLTEFLPISSAAHLILVPLLTDWDDQGLTFDLALHLGSLAAVVFYFRREILLVVHDWGGSLVTRRQTEHSRIGWAVLWGTIPVGIAGLLFKDLVETTMRTPEVGAIVIACSLIGFGLLLGLADWRFRGERTERDMRWTDVLVIGVAQALALIPGTSRSGITMTAALFMGLSREAAARFSFLLSIPVIVLATGLQLLELRDPEVQIDWRSLWLGSLVAAVSAYACIHYFLAFIKRIGMQPFVAYRVILGAILLWIFL